AFRANLRENLLSTIPIRRPHDPRKDERLMAFRPRCHDDLFVANASLAVSRRLFTIRANSRRGISWIRWCPRRRLHGSQWRNALVRLTRDFTILTVLVLILVVVSLLSFVRSGVLDLGFVLAIAVLVALRDLGAFCRGAMER